MGVTIHKLLLNLERQKMLITAFFDVTTGTRPVMNVQNSEGDSPFRVGPTERSVPTALRGWNDPSFLGKAYPIANLADALNVREKFWRTTEDVLDVMCGNKPRIKMKEHNAQMQEWRG